MSRTDEFSFSYIKEVKDWGQSGYSSKDFGSMIGVQKSTINAWRKKYPDFDRACEMADRACSLIYQSVIRDDAIDNKNVNSAKYMLENFDRGNFGQVADKRELQTDDSTDKIVHVGNFANVLEQAKNEEIIEITDFNVSEQDIKQEQEEDLEDHDI